MTLTQTRRAMAIALVRAQPRTVTRGYVGGIAAQLVRQRIELGLSNPHAFPTGRRFLRRARGGPIGARYSLLSAARTLRSYLALPAFHGLPTGAWRVA